MMRLAAVLGFVLVAFHTGFAGADEGDKRDCHIAIGMTTSDARGRWGPPAKINETVRASGTHQQWVYEGKYDEAACSYRSLDGYRYLYFENGRLVTIQR